MSCAKPPENLDTPEAVANAFLREIHDGHCKQAFAFFSQSSRERIEAESVEAAEREPYYAESYKPENLYCKPTYAHRYLGCVAGSARLGHMETISAVVTVDRKDGTDFLVPGFWPTRYVVTPVDIQMIQENGLWKIDLGEPDQRLPGEREKREEEEEKESGEEGE
ncbi:hypothetical protein HY522_07870 [bacterium]|nr:hypothetical protein [bacterium]